MVPARVQQAAAAVLADAEPALRQTFELRLERWWDDLAAGVSAADFRKPLPGWWFYAPAFVTTALTSSSITYLDGDAGGDLLYGGDGADDLEAYDGGASLLDAGAGDDYVYDEGASFVIGGRGAQRHRLGGAGGGARF